MTYKVDEKAHNGYAPRFENCDGTIIAGTTPVEARVINTRYNGNIAVTKQTTGNGGDTDTFFDFSITMKDASGVAIPREQFTVEFYDAGGNKDENRIVTGTSGTFTFKLKHGDLIVFNGLPNGTEYTVEEKNPSSNGYKSTVEEDQWTINRPGPRKAKGLDKTNTVVRTGGNTSADLVTHVFKNDRGAASLSITKEFEGCTPRTNGYEFTITLKDADGKDLAGSQWAQYTVKDETGEIGNGKIDSLKNTISLYPGETATFPKLPTGTTYTVTEKQYDGYAATEKSEGTVSKEQDGTEIKLEYLNKWKSGALEVTKTLGGPAAAGEEITFVITLDFSEADLLKSGAAVEQLADWVEAKDSGDAKVDLVKVDENKYTVTVTKEIEETDKEVTLASLTKIPVGTKYTVAEVVKTDVYDYNAEGYEVLYRRNGSELKQIEAKDYTEDGKASTEGFTIETDGQADIVAITNFRTAGSLEISKKVVSDVIIENAGEQFTFKIDLTFPRSADSTEFLNSHVHVKVDDGEKGESWANDNDLKQNDDGTWTWEIKLVDGAKATISGLPASTKYTVREVEANLNGYITTVMFNGDPVEVGAGTVANKASAENEQVDEFLCTNTRFDGNLVVMKMLDGEGAYDTDEFQFTMELTSPYGDIGGFTDSEDDVDPMGVDSDDSQNASWWANGVIEAAEYTIYKNGQDEAAHGALADLRGNDGRFRFMLRGGDLITFAKLPDEALYTVTEDTNNWNGYSTDIRAYGIMMFDDEDAAGEPEEETYEQQSSVSGMIDKNADQLLLTCVNHRGVGELAVSKLLVGTGADASRSWTFRVRLTDANGDPLTVNAWTANGEEKQLTVKETGALVTLDASGMTTLTMRGGETRTITNLPNGTRYSVEEVSANTDGYYTSSSNTTGTIYEKTEEYDGVSRVTFTNRREPGTLTVSKTVGGNAGDVYRPFEFVVTLTAPEGRPGDSLPNPVKARLEDYREGTETELTLPLSEENTVTFELTHDQAMVLLDLDEGTGYSVAETPAAGYVTRVAGDIEGVLSANGTAVAAFTNTANVYREGDDDDDDDDITRTEEQGPGEEPELPVELPNPNEPDSPDTVTILEDDVPTTYVKVPDPENEEEFIYIPEDEIPLQGFEIPETGDNGQTILWAVLSAASLTGIVALGIPSRKKEEEEQ